MVKKLLNYWIHKNSKYWIKQSNIKNTKTELLPLLVNQNFSNYRKMESNRYRANAIDSNL